MAKKKKIYKFLLKQIIFNLNVLFFEKLKFIVGKVEYYFQNIFRLTTSYKQLFFSLLNTHTTYHKQFSTGVILQKHIKSFKFFKKSIFNINPLVMIIRFSFVSFFKKLYLVESLNFTKKQFIFLKKFINSIKTELKYLIFKKT